MNSTMKERIITKHHEVRSAVVIGQSRLRPALLLEAKNLSVTATEEKERLLDGIWSTIERANLKYSEAFRIMRGLVMFTTPGKRMVRTGKGSVQRIYTMMENETRLRRVMRLSSARGKHVRRAWWKILGILRT